MAPKIFVALREIGRSPIIRTIEYSNKFKAKQAIKALRKAYPGVQYDITKNRG